MSTSWRIDTRFKDRTTITSSSSQIEGATVIKSPKGPKTFKKFNKGDTSSVINTFGFPSKDYPSIQDALDAVSKCDMYISSCYKNGLYGGVFVTPKGTISFENGLNKKEIEDFSDVKCTKTMGIGDGISIDYDYSISNAYRVSVDSIILNKNDNDMKLAFELSSGTTYNVTDQDSLLDSGTYDSSTGELKLTFVSAPDEGDIFTLSYSLDMSDTYFVLFDNDMQVDDLKIKVKSNKDITNAFDISVVRYDPIMDDDIEIKGSPFTIGLMENSKNTYGENIFIENIFNDNQVIFTPIVLNSTITTFVDDVEYIPLNGGERGEEVEDSEIALIYDELKDTNKYDIKFAFDSFASSAIASKFESLRNTSQKRCRFLYCTPDVDAESIIENTSHTYDYNITNNRGLYQYCLTWGIHKDVYQGNDFLCSNMGLIAGKLVDVLVAGGGVPAWIDSDGVGGILGSSVTKLTRIASESELKSLDDLNFNPVVMDNRYGTMIVSWKTRQLLKTVFSYIGQSSLADTVVDLIEKNVLPRQIGKLIDETAYSSVRNGISTIMNNYGRFFEDWFVKCDDGINSDEERANQTLNCVLAVIFKGYAEKVVFTFNSENQGVNLEESVMKL